MCSLGEGNSRTYHVIITELIINSFRTCQAYGVLRDQVTGKTSTHDAISRHSMDHPELTVATRSMSTDPIDRRDNLMAERPGV